MKPIGTKAINNFVAYIGGKQSLRTVKKFILTRNLYKYRLSNYFEHLDTDVLKQLSSLPCPGTQESLDYSKIRFSKLMRADLSLPENLTCQQCSKKNSCKEAFKPVRGRATVADLTRFVYSWTCTPPKEVPSMQALEAFLNPFPSFIKNLNNFPVPLKRVNEKTKSEDPELAESSEKLSKPRPKKSPDFEDPELKFSSIQASKIPKASSSHHLRKKPPIINQKFKWTPDASFQAKLQKKERRVERKRLETEVDLLVKKTTTKYSKSRDRSGFKKARRPSFSPPL